jgi:hypothetical protein
LSSLEDRGLGVWGKVVVTGYPEVLVVAGLQQQRKNNSPQLDCSGGDDRISAKCIPLENEIQKAMAMLENEKSSEQSKLVCGDQFSVRKNENVKRKLFKRTRMPKENLCIKRIGEEFLEEFKKGNSNEKQLKLAEKNLEAAKFKFEVENCKFENPAFLFNVHFSF